MKFNSLINTFTSGEWSPKMRARSDAEEYARACEKLINFLPKIQGGAFRRPGTVRVALGADAHSDLQTLGTFFNTTDGGIKSRCKAIPFVLSNESSGFLIIGGGTPSTTWLVVYADGDGVTHTANNFSSVGLGADLIGSASELVQFVQVGDYIVITGGEDSTPTRIWRPLSASPSGELLLFDTVLGPFDTSVGGSERFRSVPYLPIQALGLPNVTTAGVGITMTPSAATGTGITLTASAAYFTSGNADSYFKLSAAGNTAIFKATVYNSSTVLTGDIIYGSALVGAHGTATGTSWEESAWSTRRGYPRTVCSYQGRLIFGGNKTYPDAIWGSRIGNVFDFMERPLEQDPDFTGYTDDNSRPFTLFPSSNTTAIVGISSGKSLVINTKDGELVGYGTNGAFGPNDANIESSSAFGAQGGMPARVNNFMTFIQKGGRRVRDVVFNNDEGAYKSMDLMFVADHLSLDEDRDRIDPIVEIAASEQDSSLLIARSRFGRLFALTIDRDYKINAWSRIELGGKLSTTSPDRSVYPGVRAMCSVSLAGFNTDRVYFIVSRYVDGVSVAFLEYMDFPKEFPNFGVGSAYDSKHAYVDLKMTYNSPGVPTTTIVTGLAYLEGETFQVIADGQYIGEKVVDSVGNITVDSPAESFVFGYKYESIIKTLPIELGQQVPGSPQGFIKRIDEVMIKFYLTYGAKYGYKESDLMDIGFKDPAQIMNQPPTFFTGYKLLKFPGNYEREAQVIVKTDKPWPCNVLAIISKGILYD